MLRAAVAAKIGARRISVFVECKYRALRLVKSIGVWPTVRVRGTLMLLVRDSDSSEIAVRMGSGAQSSASAEGEVRFDRHTCRMFGAARAQI